MRTLVSMPGRNGDVLWSMPCARAISEAQGSPVDLVIGGEFAALVPLLKQQPYLGTVWSDPAWHLVPPDEWRPPFFDQLPYHPYDRIVHLGHRRWPDAPLPYRLYTQLGEEYPAVEKAALDLDRPWIAAPPRPPAQAGRPPADIAVCFSEEWIELKMGVALAVMQALMDKTFVLVGPLSLGRRGEWAQAWLRMPNATLCPCTWTTAASVLARTKVVLTCCSGLWVLANAVGTPVVLLEPSAARHNPIFWLEHPRNQKVLGGDGQPTHDARATAAALEAVLAGR